MSMDPILVQKRMMTIMIPVLDDLGTLEDFEIIFDYLLFPVRPKTKIKSLKKKNHFERNVHTSPANPN